MPNDTRDRNRYFSEIRLSRYMNEYADALREAVLSVSALELGEALRALKNAKRIFVAGNGGSATIADHLCCDWQKGTDTQNARPIQATPLTASLSMFTAIANDLGYERTFSYQLERVGLCADDVVVLISSSGNSPNILQAAKMAKFFGAKVIGMTGFDGGELNLRAEIKLHVAYDNYGIVEDCHQALMHILAQYLYLENK